ncbi:hypothetical protein M405DRAFT_747732 [Rhizopogon salebrosus TDB-379]|nr:hypothetical protein M405DRAFT_747732 [Rhizopogon salebrosus TDB-379]
MQSNYKLNCLVPGGDLSHIFEIKIAPTESVSALKELFKEKQKHAFRDVDANRLDLWKVDLSIDGTLEHNINNLELDPKKSLLPVAEMLEVFDNPPKRRHLHIVVKRPPAVVPSFNLNCLVLGDDPSHIFEIKIAPTESVSALKKVIKAEKTPQFDDVPADHLTLWKIDINLGEDEQLDLPDDAEELKPVTPLSKVFLVTPEDEHLHIMVLRPPILVPPQYVNPPAHSAQGQKC